VQNAVPIIRQLSIQNDGAFPLDGLVLSMAPQPAFCQKKSWVLDRIGAASSTKLLPLELALDLGFLDRLEEAEHGQLTFTLRQGNAVLAESVLPIELLARDEWGGTGEMASIIAAFAAPNDPEVARLLKLAGSLLEQGGHSPSLDGYQSGDPGRAFMLAAATWSAVGGMGLTYAVPPASFERQGQKIRSPRRIAAEGLATCLDTTLLLAAALEAAGLNPVVIFTTGHAFAGVWLTDTRFPVTVELDVTALRKAIASREFVVFETTLLTQRPAGGFEAAIATARATLAEENEAEFSQVIDITRARRAGIRPLSTRAAPAEADPATVVPALPLPPPLPRAAPSPPDGPEAEAETPQDRITRWQAKLLDLTLRNRLLNFRSSAQTIPLLCPDLAHLEDRLAEGGEFRVISLEEENPLGQRDPVAYRRQHGRDIHADFIASAMEKKQLSAALSGKDLLARLTALFRQTRSDLAEGGTNTLFLAAGFLRWKKSAEDSQSYRAPILLIPVKLERRSAQSAYRLSHHEDELRVNATLLQFLERDFGLRIPGLAGELPRDAAGVDLQAAFAVMRAAVRDMPGFEVVEETALATFSFAKYLMWKDLVDRTAALRDNRLVRHLIDNPSATFSGTGGGLPGPEEVDRRPPAELLTPLPADSSQLSAVLAAEAGHDFVIIGPPGTGKSQTIANMIAHCIARGKSVLFVAEKSAALDVVYRRLKANGLGDACLELHSSKADRQSVIRQLGLAWDRASAASQADWVQVTEELRLTRDQLNGYVAALHAAGSHGVSIYHAIGHAVAEAPPFRLAFAGIAAHDAISFAALEKLALELASTRASALRPGAIPLLAIAETEWSFAWEAGLFEALDRLEAARRGLQAASAGFAIALGLAPETGEAGELQRLAVPLLELAAEDLRIPAGPGAKDLSDALARLDRALAEIAADTAALAADYTEAEILRMPLEALDRDWREAGAKIWPFSALAKSRVRKLLQSYAASGTVDLDRDLPALLRMAPAVTALAASPLASLPVWQGMRTPAVLLQEHLRQADVLSEALAGAGIGGTLRDTLLGRCDPTMPALKAAATLTAAQSGFAIALASAEAVTKGRFAGTAALDALGAEIEALRAQRGSLRDWTRWCAVRRRAEAQGLTALVEALQQAPIAEVGRSFRAAYFRWWLPLALDARPELRQFAHWDQDRRIGNFRKLDAQVQTLTAAQVRLAIAHRLPARDGVPRNSELGVLRHQLSLKRPSSSIRQLVSEMPEAFRKLVPCVLMSPLSVAQYLPAGHAPFDMVIFDEASQITTWDAVGAIARGRQSVIVGDPKQLSPTNFFARGGEEDEELAAHEKDLQSILDEAAAAGLPTHQLNWHYRSRDEALIAFSNHHYYGNRLITFPSPSTRSEAVRLHRIPGTYARGRGRTNEAEAQAILALAHARLVSWLALPETVRPTLGVITFNAQQQQLILDLFDQMRAAEPALEWFFEDAREEPVIVKNLENIQGDERDVMLFSITFGPDAAGKLSMNFGALNSDGGEKRLNVAVTRARQELHIFASLGAEQIDLGRTRAEGVKHLKNFLDYAARGAAALPAMDHGSMGPTESIFEDWVAEALQGRGWEVRSQIGVSGFRIDLGIVHPDQAGTYLAGVECDGATYHRAASARDRDRIREAVLRGLGWEILRVWSTDWFMARDEALERLDTALRGLLAASRAAMVEVAASAIDVAEPGPAPEAPTGHEETLEDEDIATDGPAAKTEDEALFERKATYAGLAISAVDTASPLPGSFSRPEASEPPVTSSNASANVAVCADPQRFFEHDYTAQLQAMVAIIIERDAPLRDQTLARLVARQHGWQRTGRRIRDRVLECLSGAELHQEEVGRFVWAVGSHSMRIPFRHGMDRLASDIPQAEIVDLIRQHFGFRTSADPARDLARAMGIVRLTEETRSQLDACLRFFAKEGEPDRE
jgi:very-short-patch-repair endonuclease